MHPLDLFLKDGENLSGRFGDLELGGERVGK
jgi:hypothetical protein